jgi:hypothetical protein
MADSGGNREVAVEPVRDPSSKADLGPVVAAIGGLADFVRLDREVRRGLAVTAPIPRRMSCGSMWIGSNRSFTVASSAENGCSVMATM